MINQDENEMKLRIKCVLMSCQFEEQFENIKKKAILILIYIEQTMIPQGQVYESQNHCTTIAACNIIRSTTKLQLNFLITQPDPFEVSSLITFFFCFSIPNAETQNKHDTK